MKRCIGIRVLALLAAGCGLGGSPVSAGGADAAGVTAGPSAREPVHAYVCEGAGVRTYSDRPCSGAATAVRLAAPNGYVAPEIDRRPVRAPESTAPRGRAARSSAAPASAGSVERGRTRARCRTLQRRLEHVDAELRRGYGAAEGRRLGERRRELREDLRYYGCG